MKTTERHQQCHPLRALGLSFLLMIQSCDGQKGEGYLGKSNSEAGLEDENAQSTPAQSDKTRAAGSPSNTQVQSSIPTDGKTTALPVDLPEICDDNALSIVGGCLTEKEDPGFKSTVFVYDEAKRTFCTGSILANDLILTAAHCLQGAGLENLTLYFGLTEQGYLSKRPVTEFKLFNTEWNADSAPNEDIAWARFSGGIPTGFESAKVFAEQGNLSGGEPIVLTGYGITNDGEDDGGTLRSVQTVFDRYVETKDFWGIFLVGPTLAKSACHGDSGGPAFVFRNGAWVVAGIVHGVHSLVSTAAFQNGPDKVCASGHVIMTAVEKYLSWLESTSGNTVLRAK
jgi:hypothetical protein